MALNNGDQVQLRDYLLGRLSGDEQQKIEERLMVEDELFDEFEASKDELVEEYHAGELAQNERQWLEENFLATSEGRERYAFTLAMECLQQRPDPLPDPPEPVVPTNPRPWIPPDPQPAFLGPIQAFARTQPWAFAATSLVLVLLVVFALKIIVPHRERPVFSATLESGLVVRGEGAPTPNLTLPPNIGKLKLRLKLPKTPAPNTRYKAELDDRVNTKTVEIVESDPEAVTVIVPAELVTHGLYQLTLNTTKPDGTEEGLSFPFNVQ
jgi:hypothetical protein